MNKKEIMRMLIERILSCYDSLLFSRDNGSSKLRIEGFRSRLDELLLMYHIIKGISFIEGCKILRVNYKDLDANSQQSVEVDKK